MSADRRPTLGELALEVRSKNAGPFWVTMELFMRDAEGYALVADWLDLDELAARVAEASEALAEGRVASARAALLANPQATGAAQADTAAA